MDGRGLSWLVGMAVVELSGLCLPPWLGWFHAEAGRKGESWFFVQNQVGQSWLRIPRRDQGNMATRRLLLVFTTSTTPSFKASSQKT